MAAKPVRFHEDADAEYENAFDWYLARSPRAAAEFAAELSRAVELIAQAPRRWAPGLGGFAADLAPLILRQTRRASRFQ